MALVEQPLITNSQHNHYSSTGQKQDLEGSLVNSTPTEAPHSGTLVCFCNTVHIIETAKCV